MTGSSFLELSSANRGLIALLASLAAIGALSTNIILPAFPDMAAELGVGSRAMGYVLSCFLFPFAVGQLFVGPWSDQVGRKPVILSGLLLFAAGSIICAVAQDLSLLLAGRAIQALGVSAATVLSRAIARDLFEGEALAKTLALTMTAMAAAPGFSPLLGSGLAATVGWRVTFVLVGASGIVIAGIYSSRLGETRSLHLRQRLSFVTIVSSYIAIGRDQRFIQPALAVALVLGGLYAFFGIAPSILLGRMGLSPVQLGLFFAATVFVVFGAGMAVPLLVHKFGATALCRAGTLFAIVGGGVLVWQGDNLPGFSAGLVLYLLGMGLLNPAGTALALQPFGREAGLASALLGFLQMVVAGFGTAALATFSVSPTLALGTMLTILAFLAFFVIPRSH
ncbi:Bcr/CflA family efflux MFS transporter [Roseibium sp. M-1]